MTRQPLPTDYTIGSYLKAVRAAGKSGKRLVVPCWAWDALVAAGWA